MRFQTLRFDFVRHTNARIAGFQDRAITVAKRSNDDLTPPRGDGEQPIPTCDGIEIGSRTSFVAEMISHLECRIAGIEDQVFQDLLQVRRVAANGQRFRCRNT